MTGSSWLESAAAGVLTLWLGLLSWVGRREVKRIDGKADRDQVERMLAMMERRDERYREDMTQASTKRGEMHKKIDGVIDKLNETNVQLARIAGRLNGDGK